MKTVKELYKAAPRIKKLRGFKRKAKKFGVEGAILVHMMDRVNARLHRVNKSFPKRSRYNTMTYQIPNDPSNPEWSNLGIIQINTK